MAEFAPEVATPEVIEAPAAEAAPTTDPTAEPVAEEAQPEAKPERTFSQKELDEIVQKRLSKESRRIERVARAEAEAAHYKRLLEEKTQPTQQPQKADGMPSPAQFQDYESYIAALTDWKVDQKLGTMRSESESQQQQRQAYERSQAVAQKLSSAATKYADFEEVAYAPNVPITEPMAAAIADSDIGGEVAYYLGSNLDEAHRISQLSPTRQIREIAKLETKLAAPAAPTRTPAPIVPSATKAVVTKDPASMSYDEFVAFRRKQIAARR